MTIIDKIQSKSTYISDMEKWGSLKAKHSIILTYEGVSRNFTYFCGLNIKPTKEDLLLCLMLDFDCTNLKAMEELGYNIEYGNLERVEAINIIQQVKRNNEDLLAMFSPSEIEEIRTLTEDYWKWLNAY